MALLSAICPELGGGVTKVDGIMENITGMSVVSAGGPEGQDAWQFENQGDQFRHVLPDVGSDTIGFSFKWRVGNDDDSTFYQWMRFDGSDGIENFRVGFESATGKIRVSRNAIVAGYATTLPDLGDWLRIMGWVTMHNTAGTVKLWVNDTLQLNVTGVDTAHPSTLDFFRCYVGAGPGALVQQSGAATKSRVCDIVYWDDTGTDFNTAPDAAPIHLTFRASRLAPNSDSTAVFTRSAGSVNADLVDETPPDDDTTYVESPTVTDQDELDVEAVPAAATSIFGVFPWAYWKEIGTARTLGINVLSGATESTPTARAGIATYKWFGGPGLGEDPDTATTWTASGVNAAKLVYSVEA